MRLVAAGLILFLTAWAGWYFWPKEKQLVLSPEAPYLVIEKPWEKYSFPKLRERVFRPEGIWIDGGPLGGETSMFYYWADGKKISGQIHLPAQAGKPEGSDPSNGPPGGEAGWPVVIMLRGYVDREIYRSGIGTERAAEVFAQNGYVTLAPDFLGYGESDSSFTNNLEDRFFHPIEILQLIASLPNLDFVNPERVAIWGHSNGGQIALSVLEISGKNYPTSLWAPVSKPFPYSILYYTDEADDHGKALRRVVAGFEAMYDADEFSIHYYYDWINAPVQIHQGTADDAVPLEWSKELEQVLTGLDKEAELYLYPGADHNLAGGDNAWNLAVSRSVLWFNTY